MAQIQEIGHRDLLLGVKFRVSKHIETGSLGISMTKCATLFSFCTLAHKIQEIGHCDLLLGVKVRGSPKVSTYIETGSLGLSMTKRATLLVENLKVGTNPGNRSP